MTKNVWIDLDTVNGHQCESAAWALLAQLNIDTDAWGRVATRISDEAFNELRKFEAEHSSEDEVVDGEFVHGYQCSIVEELSDEAFANAGEIRININGKTSYSWQRNAHKEHVSKQ